MKEHLPKSSLGYAAFGLLSVSVVVHLLGGLTQLFAAFTNSGIIAYALLMLIGFAIPVVTVGAMVSGVLQPRATYATLSGVMVLYIIAYADVHAIGILETLTGADLHTYDHNGHDDHGHHHDDHGHDHHGHDHNHEGSTLNVVGDHLVDDPIALFCKISEGSAAVLFAMLALREE